VVEVEVVDADVTGGEGARRQPREERPDSNRRRDPDPLEYVEDQMHRGVP
jgi:hypothetical protein